MNPDDLKQLNIDNLTSLWRKMGVNKNSPWAKNGLRVSTTWPHRYWFDWSANTQLINSIVPELHQLPASAIVPVWTGAEAAAQLEIFLTDECFQVLFSQQAMYLDLQSQSIPELPELDVLSVQAPADLQIWVATASAAFGYTIDIAAINAIVALPEVKLLLQKDSGQAVATALVYQTGDIIGVHLVGVPEAYRGRGFARTMMQQVIKLSMAMGGKYLTLQASVTGEPLYVQLGFVPQFSIRNYKRTF
jgi:GNAT superfamily N-acetyltransferase